MIKTFTPELELTGTEKSEKKELSSDKGLAPSAGTIANILSFSRNLEVKRSKLITNVEWIKS